MREARRRAVWKGQATRCGAATPSPAEAQALVALCAPVAGGAHRYDCKGQLHALQDVDPLVQLVQLRQQHRKGAGAVGNACRNGRAVCTAPTTGVVGSDEAKLRRTVPR